MPHRNCYSAFILTDACFALAMVGVTLSILLPLQRKAMDTVVFAHQVSAVQLCLQNLQQLPSAAPAKLDADSHATVCQPLPLGQFQSTDNKWCYQWQRLLGQSVVLCRPKPPLHS